MEKTKFFRSIIVTFIFLFFIPNIAITATERRTALVIGNSDYKSSYLRNPVNDATDIAVALKKLRFQVTLKTNASQKTMEESIRSFGRKLRSGGVGLFYYAGHGIQYRGTNFLIPVKAGIESEADVKYRSVDAGYVLAQMEEAGNNLNIIILDACRNNPFARTFRSAEQGLAKMDAPTGSILAYATAPGSVAIDGSGNNGLYTSKLLVHIKDPILKIEEVFKKVRIDVMRDSGKKQVPWESSSLIGDFYFVPKRGIKVTKLGLETAKPPTLNSAKVDKIKKFTQESLAEQKHSDWRTILSEGKIFSMQHLKMFQIGCMVVNMEKEFEFFFANSGNGINVYTKKLKQLYGEPNRIDKNLDLKILLRPRLTGTSYHYGEIGILAEEPSDEIIGLFVPKTSYNDLAVHVTNILNK